MVSRYLVRIEQQIAAAPDRVSADCLRAERASYLARQGMWDDAGRDIAALHAQYDARPHVRVSAWLNLAEGLLSFYQDMGATATDKVRRAYALSAASGFASLQARAAAWLANFDYNAHRFESLARYVGEAIKLATEDDHGVHSRACLVVGQALHQANRAELAMPWYAASHRHAVSEGDDAMTGALMYNMASIRATNLRLVELAGVESSEKWNLVHLGAASAQNFDALIGTQSFDTFAPLVRAQLMSNHGKWTEALEVYRRYAGPANQQGLSRLQCWYLSDMAWCQVKSGDPEGALASINQALKQIGADSHIDDVAATHSRASQVFAALGDSAIAHGHNEEAQRAWDGYRASQQKVVSLLASLSFK